MKNYVVELEKDEQILEQKIKKQSIELERAEKRLKSLTNVRPHYMDEYERQEQELERLYQAYLEKFRNLDYLEHQMDLYTQAEEEKFNSNQEALRKMREKIKAEEWKMLRGEDENVYLYKKQLISRMTKDKSNNFLPEKKPLE